MQIFPLTSWPSNCQILFRSGLHKKNQLHQEWADELFPGEPYKKKQKFTNITFKRAIVLPNLNSSFSLTYRM